MTDQIRSLTEPGETIGIGDTVIQVTPHDVQRALLDDCSPLDRGTGNLVVKQILPRAKAVHVAGVHSLPRHGQRKRFTKRVPLDQIYLQAKADC